MQRYRVNYGLLVGLVLGVIVFAGGAYALYRYQDSAKADRYLRRAEEAEQSGDILKIGSWHYYQRLWYSSIQREFSVGEFAAALMDLDLDGEAAAGRVQSSTGRVQFEGHHQRRLGTGLASQPRHRSQQQHTSGQRNAWIHGSPPQYKRYQTLP
jgi:hypothetical protein